MTHRFVGLNTLALLAALWMGCSDDPAPSPQNNTNNATTNNQICQPGQVAPSCESCASGTFDHDSDPATPCQAYQDCQPGTYVAGAGTNRIDRSCVPCLAGSFTDTVNATSCTDWQLCSPGEFVQSSGTDTSDSVCKACLTGKYTTASGRPACDAYTPCSVGQAVVTPGTATSDQVCGPCEPGNYCAGGSLLAEPCAAGTWDDDADPATECVPHATCPPGTYVSQAGTATQDKVCTACADGEYASTDDAVSCAAHTECGNDTFVAAEPTRQSDRVCQPCAEGRSVGPNASACSIGDNYVSAAATMCRIAANTHELDCWGYDTGGYFDRLPTTDFRTLSLGNGTFCGISSGTNTLECLGGTAVESEPGGAFASVSAGYNYACGVRQSDQAGLCWGQESRMRVSGVAGRKFHAISAGDFTACGVLASDRSLTCWGEAFPTPPTGEFATVGVSEDFACALSYPDRAVTCWGAGPAATDFPTTGSYKQLAVGRYHVCALRDDGQAICWGEDVQGETDDPNEVYAQLYVADRLSCGRRAADDALECWGRDNGGLESGVPNARTFQSVHAGFEHWCGVDLMGVPQCFGANGSGQLTGLPGVPVTDLNTGAFSTCAVRAADGTLWCSPVAGAPATGGFDRVETTDVVACARDASTHVLTCFGAAMTGTPTAAVLDFSAHGAEACAVLEADGSLVCWGATQLNNTKPSGTFDRVEVSVGLACARDASTHVLTCWTNTGLWAATPTDAVDDFGLGTTGYCAVRASDKLPVCGPAQTPLTRAPATPLQAVSVRDSQACGLRLDNTMTCWGQIFWNP